MKKTLIVLLCLTALNPAFSQTVDWFEGSLKDALKEAKKTDKFVLIEFYAYGYA